MPNFGGSFDIAWLRPLMLLRSLRMSGTALKAITGVGPLPFSIDTFHIYGTGVTSLPEGIFEPVEGSGPRVWAQSVSMSVGQQFSNPCPPGLVGKLTPDGQVSFSTRSYTTSA